MFCKENAPIVMYNNNFRECILYISYPIYDYKDEFLKVLENVICDKSIKYDTDKKKYLAIIDNYLLSCNGRISFLGDTPFLEFKVSFPSYNSLGVDIFKNNLLFIKELIYNALSFKEDRVNDIKTIIKENINKRFKDAFWYYDYMNDKLIDEGNFLVSNVILNPDLLDNVNSENLFDFYQKIISGSPFVFLIGDVANDSERIIKDVFLDGVIKNVSFEKRYSHFCKNINSEVDVFREKTCFKTSAVYYSYKVRDMESDRDRVLLLIIKMLISSSDSDVLFDTLRSKNNLVYRCSCSYYRSFGSLVMKAFTDKENISLVQSLYNDIMIRISDINYINEKLPLFVKRNDMIRKIDKEKIWGLLVIEIDKFFEYDMDNVLDIMKTITPLEVSNFIKDRLVLTNIYIGEGDNNE